MKHWDEIVEGRGARFEKREGHLICDEWWQETCYMVDAAYERFWAKRGMKPPPVSRELLTFGDDVWWDRSASTATGFVCSPVEAPASSPLIL